MAKCYQTAFQLYPYKKVKAQDSVQRHPVVIVGGGPVGMVLALDLCQRGTPVLVLDDHDGVGLGSRAICFARRTLEIADRLGFGAALIEKGVQWQVGKVFYGADKVFEFNLSPEAGYKAPAFINLQQPYFEKLAVEQIRKKQAAGAPVEIRGLNDVIGVEDKGDFVRLTVDTPDGEYQLEADFVIACDGARSRLRTMLGLSFEGRVFEDNFLIADVKMKADFPPERWFWFEPPFEGAGQSALLHKQPDDLWRIDFQLGRDIDRKAELEPLKIRARVDAMLGPDADYALEWTSIYTFQCRRMKKFSHGRVLFAGDSAHQVSPFGARGANSGIQDAENLAWKLDLVIKGLAPEALLETYRLEREYAADENILNSTRATDFLTPKSEMSKIFRNAVLKLAGKYPFARGMVNSGRLSVPCVYDGSHLNFEDEFGGPEIARIGASCPDAPHENGYLLDFLTGGFDLLAINTLVPSSLEVSGIHVNTIVIDRPSAALCARYLNDAPSAVYLVRPDQHICARWLTYDAAKVSAAVNHVCGRG